MNCKPVVYVVDDEIAIREMARCALERMGLEVRCFDSGRSFLEQYEPLRGGCLITDLHMPDMTGQEILEVLAKRRAALSVIMMSGRGDIRAAVRAIGIGAVEFLEKPCSISVLRETVQLALQLTEKRQQEAASTAAVVAQLQRLTADERVTLKMILLGKPDKAIASKLDVSVRTIQFRRAGVMRKLCVKTRAELIRVVTPHAQAFLEDDHAVLCGAAP